LESLPNFAVWVPLKELDISQTAVSDFSPLKDLFTLKSLRADSLAVSLLKGFEHISSVEELRLAYNIMLNDISPFKMFFNLKLLDLRHTGVNDVAALVSNPGFADGDDVLLYSSKVEPDSDQVSQLESKNVNVCFEANVVKCGL
jgi:Leucine-rich repeat (LRR) protein